MRVSQKSEREARARNAAKNNRVNWAVVVLIVFFIIALLIGLGGGLYYVFKIYRTTPQNLEESNRTLKNQYTHQDIDDWYAREVVQLNRDRYNNYGGVGYFDIDQMDSSGVDEETINDDTFDMSIYEDWGGEEGA